MKAPHSPQNGTMKNLISLSTAFVLLAMLTGCQQGADQSVHSAESEPTATQASMAESAMELPDTTGASLWAYLQESNYPENWTSWPNKGALYTGQQPHGMLLTTYLNDAALAALTAQAGAMPAGAIVVKENYMGDSTLAAVTVMYKVAGYNPEHGDWFFTKHLPDGTLDTAPNGMALEGRLMGCQNCHGAVKPNDYIFTGPLAAAE
jgi:hypothetical protein